MTRPAILFLLGLSILKAGIAISATPKQMLENVWALTDASALLNVCFESEESNNLPTEKALLLIELESRLSKLVEGIAEHYDDNSLLLTYELARVENSSDPGMKNYSKEKYGYCGDNLFTDMEQYVSENEKAIGGYLSRSSNQGKTPWPKSAKKSYVDRCEASLTAQGSESREARRNCTCVADGMEREFGMEEYEQMMRAQPNPAGNNYDKRLYKVFAACRQ